MELAERISRIKALRNKAQNLNIEARNLSKGAMREFVKETKGEIYKKFRLKAKMSQYPNVDNGTDYRLDVVTKAPIPSDLPSFIAKKLDEFSFFKEQENYFEIKVNNMSVVLNVGKYSLAPTT